MPIPRTPERPRCRPRRGVLAFACLAVSLVGGTPAPGQGPREVAFGPEEDERTEGKVFVSYIIPDDGLLDDGFVDKWERRLDDVLRAEGGEITFVIFRIDTRGVAGGAMAPVERVVKRIRDLRGIHTIAHIDNGSQASNGAALIPLACKKLVMGQTARLGWLDDPETAIPDDGEHEAHKARALFAHQATLKHGVPAALVEAFVSRHHGNVYRVTYDVQAGNNVESKTEVMSEELIEERQRNLIDKMSMKIREKAPITTRGERLTLTAAEARSAGLAQLVVATSFDEEGGREEVLAGLSILVGGGDVIDQYRGTMAARTEGEKATIEFLNHPVTRFILLLCAFLGLVIEFKMPGTFIPMACSAVCFLIFFIAGSFEAPGVTGVNEPTTSPFEIVLFVIGLGLVVTELFLLPGVIIFGLLGVILMLVSLVLAMVPPAHAIGEPTMGFRGALNILLLALGTGFGAFFVILKLLPRSSFFNRSGLITNAAIVGIPNADSIVEGQERNAPLLGKIGIAITSLRPAGKVEVEGQVLDVVAEGDFVEKGEKVEVIDASVFRAVVKRRG